MVVSKLLWNWIIFSGPPNAYAITGKSSANFRIKRYSHLESLCLGQWVAHLTSPIRPIKDHIQEPKFSPT